MKPCIKFIKHSWFILICVTCSLSFAEKKPPEFVLEARQITVVFQQILKQELQAAMQSGGPIKAIEVCHTKAPEIAKKLGMEKAWNVGRTSLKARNPKNAPTDQERQVLNHFQSELVTGKPVATLEWWNENDEKISYMKAIPTQGLCLTCHGKNIQPAIKKHIATFYPNDMATGFDIGEIRGAFSLIKQK